MECISNGGIHPAYGQCLRRQKKLPPASYFGAFSRAAYTLVVELAFRWHAAYSQHPYIDKDNPRRASAALIDFLTGESALPRNTYGDS